MTVAPKSIVSILALIFALSVFSAPRARAEASIGDAVITVGVSTLAGAVLGASTLPFYEESGEHTNNIFYGAAIGAVIGVFVSAYAGVQEGPNYDDARLAPTKPSALSLNEYPGYRLRSESTTAVRATLASGAGSTLAWAPLKTFRF